MSLRRAVLDGFVAAYLRGDISLDSLKAWFIPWAWDSDLDDASQRVFGVLAAADEWPEDQLRDKLIAALMDTRALGQVAFKVPPPAPTKLRLDVSPSLVLR